MQLTRSLYSCSLSTESGVKSVCGIINIYKARMVQNIGEDVIYIGLMIFRDTARFAEMLSCSIIIVGRDGCVVGVLYL